VNGSSSSSAGSGAQGQLRKVVVANCPACNWRFAVPEKFAGKRVRCPKCTECVTIPEAAHGIATIRCTSCQHTFAVPEDFKGRRIRCPDCHEWQSVPAEVKAQAAGVQSVAQPRPCPDRRRPVRDDKWRRLLHCPHCQAVFPVALNEPPSSYSCTKCHAVLHDGYCLRQEEDGQYYFHTSWFGGVRHGPYATRDEAKQALLNEYLRKHGG